ncbi:hypothetical protein PRUPE_6G175700 [Prunus persica]|uniref:Uncharacterized protein n=1 Tax=Prunus persica TaxID=3760 RepID=A0A251NTN1_PRUPE|nr:hypothetical protein PRUPE_6G175700 [Prunus persica]
MQAQAHFTVPFGISNTAQRRSPLPLTRLPSLTQSASTFSPLPVFSSKFRTQHSSLIPSLPIARFSALSISLKSQFGNFS